MMIKKSKLKNIALPHVTIVDRAITTELYPFYSKNFIET